ncbi:unnamed protein product, partial [Oncorhynchus mykiss]
GRTESSYFPEVDHVTTRERMEDPAFNLTQLVADLRALEEENWLSIKKDPTRGPSHLKDPARGPSHLKDPDRGPSHLKDPARGPSHLKDPTRGPSHLKDPTSKPSEREREAPPLPPLLVPPPIPPRTTSWYLASPSPELQLHVPESLSGSGRKKCSSSPSIVRKFEAMLQENEGKVLTEAGFTTCAVPVNSRCNVGCCHNRWPCDGSSKSSTYMPVHKSLSEVNIVNSKPPDSNPPGSNPPGSNPPGSNPPGSNPPGHSRNMMLEQATAEFNRTLFQAEMGRGMEDDDVEDSFTSAAGPPNSLSKPTLHRSISSEYKQPAQTTHTAPGPEVSASPKRDIKAQGARPHSVKSCPAPQPPTNLRPRQVGQPGCRSTTTQDILKAGSVGSGLRVPGGSGLRVPGGDQPWKPLTLAALRPSDSRSNYGAVERILKSYENTAWSQRYQNHTQPTESSPNPGLSPSPNPGLSPA